MSYLVVIGSGIFVALGLLHALLTVQSSPGGGPMAPTDAGVRQAMTVAGGLGLAPDSVTTLWRAWVGFNLSHSLGAVIGGLFVALPAATDFQAALDRPWWVALALAVPPVYLAISNGHWFRGPTTAIAICTGLVMVGVLGGLLL